MSQSATHTLCSILKSLDLGQLGRRVIVVTMALLSPQHIALPSVLALVINSRLCSKGSILAQKPQNERYCAVAAIGVELINKRNEHCSRNLIAIISFNADWSYTPRNIVRMKTASPLQLLLFTVIVVVGVLGTIAALSAESAPFFDASCLWSLILIFPKTWIRETHGCISGSASRIFS